MMERRIGIFLASLLLTAPFATAEELKGTVTLSGAWAIYPAAVAWGEAFQKAHPKVKIEVSAGGAGKGASDAIVKLVDIGMVSRDPEKAELEKGVIAIPISEDAVFPVVSEKNPAAAELLQKGISREKWFSLYVTGEITQWDELAGKKIGKPVHVYTRSDASGAASCWAKFLGGEKQEDLKGIGVYGDPGILEAVKRDPLGVAYSNFGYVFTREGGVLPGLRVVPIDTDGNGNTDGERFDVRARAAEAVHSGQYPASRKNYFFVMKKPEGLVKAFLAFILSEEGSRIAEESGVTLPLLESERQKILENLE